MIIRAAHADDVPSLVELYSDWGHPQPAGVAAVSASWRCDRVELTSSRWRNEAPDFYLALGYEDQSERQARFVRPLRP